MRKFPGNLISVLKQSKYHSIIAVLTVVIISSLCAPLVETENYHVVPYLLLLGVSVLATFMSVIPVLIASTLSALVWNFFFIPPHFTFHIAKPEDILLFSMFFMIAILNGILSSRLRQMSEIAQEAHFLSESDKLYKTLFNSISHELRIPVSTIMGASENLLQSKYPPEIQAELTSEIFTASLRLNRVIENLLNMSRLESGRISAHIDWHDVNDLVNKAIGDLADELRDFILVIDIPENMPLIKIDFGLMEHVLYNLIYNSTQYAPKYSEITIRTCHQDDVLVLQVSDQGPGFPEDKIDHVFNKFFRIESKRPGGLGLGLSIVKGFVEAHKGKITVENQHPKGALFTIYIPSELPPIENFKV